VRGIWIPARFFVGAAACGHLAGRPRVYRVRNEGGKEYALQVASETVRVSLQVAPGAVRVSHGAATLMSFLLLTLLIHSCLATPVTIDNTHPKITIEGELMDAHDGMIVRWPNTTWPNKKKYLWYGMGYRNCTEKNGDHPMGGFSAFVDFARQASFHLSNAPGFMTTTASVASVRTTPSTSTAHPI
jgi:hypothetical protein